MSPRPKVSPPLSYWALVAAGEPFRLLFPLGTLFGLVGIGLWPLFVWLGFLQYPGILHARIMIEGFVAAFVIGFLGTALPRLLDTPRFSLRETLSFAILLCAVVACQVSGQIQAGDSIFLITLLLFLITLLRRFLQRQDNPPPAFVLVAGGLLCALFGVSIQICGTMLSSAGLGWTISFGRLLLYQGFVLLPILGVGAFLLPRFFNLPNRQILPESRQFSATWKRRALFAASCGFLILASFLLEAFSFYRSSATLRGVAVGGYLLRELPLHLTFSAGGSLAAGLRIALFAIPLGYVLMALFPSHSLSWIHVVFITGFSLMIFIVASRVLLGHSGQSAKFSAPLWPIRILTALLVTAMLTRVGTDWIPELRFDHYAYAAICWILGVLLWALLILPAVRKPEENYEV